MSLSSLADHSGLDAGDRSDWPRISSRDADLAPIDRLVPNSKLHRYVLDYLLTRIDASERQMALFYARWRANEARHQAYLNLTDYELTLKQMNNNKEPPKVVSIVIPYSFATISAICTYLANTFLGRKPILQISAAKPEAVEPARNMELALQYQADHIRLAKEFFQWLQDGQIYGVGAMIVLWKNEKAMRTVWKSMPRIGFGGVDLGAEQIKSREYRTVYEGNTVFSIDPFMFFPDPRVPMMEVNKRGEYVTWRAFCGKHELKRDEAAGDIKWVDYATPTLPGPITTGTGPEQSARNLLSGGVSHPGYYLYNQGNARAFFQKDQGSFEIIPAELGLGESTRPEKWIFTILNKSQIVQAEPLNYDHSMHPVVINEPYSMGYGFGNPGITDYIAPLQDTMSWFINSRISNVRTAINNMFVVDPSRIEMQDLKHPGAGKLIRLKRSAYGQDVQTIINQLIVQDVTANHISDIQLLMRLADAISAVNENLRGTPQQGGRKTATEVRTAGEAAALRLGNLAQFISAHGVTDLSEQMSINTIQFAEDEFYYQIAGTGESFRISPEMLVGDFHYPVNDGTLPLDKVALLEVWKEIMMGVAQDQQLRGSYSLPKIFEWVAELGGARNISSFRLTPQPDVAIQQQAQAGNVVQLPAPRKTV